MACFAIVLALCPMTMNKNVPEILSVGLRINNCRKNFFLVYRVRCVKLSQQVNVASFSKLVTVAIHVSGDRRAETRRAVSHTPTTRR